jgi:K+-sensing histidine kinase KdpD
MSTLGTDQFLAGSKPTKAAGSGTPRTDFGIAGVIGAELSMPLHTLRRIIQALGESDRLSAGEVRELEQALEQANLIVRQSQQLARLSEGRLRQSHERVSLDQMVQSALQERHATFQERGIQLAQAIKPVEIVVDPGLLSNLV